MKKLLSISRKKTKMAIGLLSGTSVDGIDAVLISISGEGVNTKLKVIDFETYPISSKIKESVLKNSSVSTARIDEISRLNAILGVLFAKAALALCKKNRIRTDSVDFIGSHGQTIHHLPGKSDFHGHKLKSTLQIGDPSIIANITGITTVGDFRTADTAVNGDGAPLVPYLDYILFSSKDTDRALLNIGGISNITILPRGCKRSEVRAFDTGPGNMLIDGLMKRLYGKKMDKEGKIALSGRINDKFLDWLKMDDYYASRPPKSSGREHYCHDTEEDIIKYSKDLPKKDIIATISEFTAYTIWYNYHKFLEPRTKIKELLLSGGGAKNPFIYKRLSDYFKGVKLSNVNKLGIDIDNKEAVLFAVLANECLAGNSANMPSVTGAKKSVILGKICQA
jgi:anhydro-N-acetylmuramic acid kinase